MNFTKWLFVVVAVSCAVRGQTYNVTTVWDTAVITDFKADSIKSTKAFQVGRYEDPAVIVLVDDTSSAGFASDSIGVLVGFIGGYLTFDSSYAIDTTWRQDSVTIDTVLTANLGAGSMGTTDVSGTVTATDGGVDTSNVTGWAVWSQYYTPPWYPLLKYFVKGVGDNETGSNLKLIIQHSQREHSNVQ